VVPGQNGQRHFEATEHPEYGKVLLPLKVSPQQKMTLQSQVFDQIRRMILDGRLRSGDFLPTTRTLSEQIGISRNTIVLAYERLMAEGYIQTRPYVGTFVSAEIPDTAFATSPEEAAKRLRSIESRCCFDEATALRLDGMRSQLVVNPHAEKLAADFWAGRPAPDSFPAKAWANLVWKRLQTAGSAITQYQDPAGLMELRQAIADYLGPTRGVIADPEQIIIVGGTQDGLNLVARLLVDRGSTVVVESPCYQGAAYLFETFGADLYPVPVDSDGIKTERLPDMRNPITYVTPSHQYPLGVTLSLERRIALLTWAGERNGYIVEDDYDSDFRFVGSPLTALKGIDRNERVFYLGTFSKCMGPALRLGFVVVPTAFAKAARTLKALMNNGQSWLEQAALADFMTSGAYSRHLRRIRQVYLSRRNATLQALKRHFGENEVVGSDAGMHLVWRLPSHLPNAAEIETRALTVGVGVYTLNSGAALNLTDPKFGDRHLVLGFAALSECEIELGIARLAACLASKTPKGTKAKKLVFDGTEL
jgi:GntR family transcriptional regulator/MocR family aminotransferase